MEGRKTRKARAKSRGPGEARKVRRPATREGHVVPTSGTRRRETVPQKLRTRLYAERKKKITENGTVGIPVGHYGAGGG